ncbi:hypothetical protein JOB18_022302 [Solea senegalensis]|uniref:Uncharacterized protein n=1 Tax=Solea senegalensis TaxID=28829 RepID=A0AAV6QPD7_SOLSE|nr:hypothetical protein JOB18_022302 [Solea senegalensis]
MFLYFRNHTESRARPVTSPHFLNQNLTVRDKSHEKEQRTTHGATVNCVFDTPRQYVGNDDSQHNKLPVVSAGYPRSRGYSQCIQSTQQEVRGARSCQGV